MLYERMRFPDISTGYIVKVSIHVPVALHDTFDFAPIAKGEISKGLLSEMTKSRMGDAPQHVKLYPFLGRQANKLYLLEHLSVWVHLGVVVEDV